MKLTDPYDILKLEFPGIKGVIENYTSNSTINNYLIALENALAADDVPTVLYTLEEIKNWYDKNIYKIHKNSYVHNKEEHDKVKAKIERLLTELNSYDFSNITSKQKVISAKGNKVFVVHGHDTEAKITVARTLEQLGLEAVILHEQPDEGKTIIEKLETFTSEAAYAIVLYTECDVGRAKEASEESNKSRARQNVVFEHGLFIGSLGRKNVCALVKGKVEKPGDVDGVVYVAMDDAGAWKLQLCSNMKAAGLNIDLNKLL